MLVVADTSRFYVVYNIRRSLNRLVAGFKPSRRESGLSVEEEGVEMASDAIRKLLADQERLRKLTNPLGDLERFVNPAGSLASQVAAVTPSLRLFEHEAVQQKILASIYGSSSFARIHEDMEKRRKMLEGPIAEARRIGLFDPQSDLQKSISTAAKAQSAYQSAFRLPKQTELSRLVEQATQASSVASALISQLNKTDSLHAAMQRMTYPWLNKTDPSHSVTSFARLVALGQGLARPRPFASGLTDRLRLDLGDWRDPISVADQTLINPVQRTELYLEQGFDPTLTDFPVPAFHEGAILGGLEPSADDGGDTSDQSEDVEFIRAERAFAQLRRFEVAVRNFIVAVMESTFGEHWMKRQLPKDMRDKWVDKRQKEIDAGRLPRPLIEYADFSDYKMIIERGDNWKGAFKSVFNRPEDIRESFQRLNPVRIATMHSRIVTLDDELLLMVETRRVLKAIQAQSE